MYSFTTILTILSIVTIVYLSASAMSKQNKFRQFFLNKDTLELYTIEYNIKIDDFQVKNCTKDIVILQASYKSCFAYVNKLNLTKIGKDEGELKK